MTHRRTSFLFALPLITTLAACGAPLPSQNGPAVANSTMSVGAERLAAAKAEAIVVKSDEKSVLDAFSELVSAADQRDATAFQRYCGADAMDWYGQAVNAAITIGRDDLDSLPKTTKYSVLRLRHMFTRDELTQTPRAELFRSAHARGAFIVPSALRDAQPGAIRLQGDRAELSLAEAPDLFIFSFHRESSGWKINWSELIEMDEAAMPELIEQSGLSEDDYMVDLIERDSGLRVDRKIFDGPLKTLAQQSLPEATKVTLQTVSDSAKTLRISAPAEWRRVNKRGALIHAASDNMSITVSGVRATKDAALADFAAQTADTMLKGLRDGRIESAEDAVVNDEPARMIVLSYTVEEPGKPARPVLAMVVLVQHGRRFYQITATGPAARYVELEPLMWQMVASFQVLK